MNKGLYIAASGMNYQVQALNESAANLANASTSGYKRTEILGRSFDNLVTQFSNPTPFDHTGYGVQTVGHARILQQGALIQTHNPLSVALSGPGYFQSQDATGAVQLTRNGDFRLDNGGFLATQTGDRILDVNNQPIPLGALATESLRIHKDGVLLDGDRPIGRLKIVAESAANPVTFPASTLAEPALQGGSGVEQGYLEQSNVNVVSEMVNMITINKAYTFDSKAITTEDNLLNKTVNDLGRLQ
jgi:flagellar basal-body rod protein FlgF